MRSSPPQYFDGVASIETPLGAEVGASVKNSPTHFESSEWSTPLATTAKLDLAYAA